MKSVAKGIFIALILGLTQSPGAIRAEGSQPTGETSHARSKRAHHKMDVDKKLEKVTRKYHLTQDQQEQVRKLMEERIQKMDEAKKNYHEQFRSILTDEQKKLDTRGEAPEETGHR